MFFLKTKLSYKAVNFIAKMKQKDILTFILLFFTINVYATEIQKTPTKPNKFDEINAEDLIINEEDLPLKLADLIYLALERNTQAKIAFKNVRIAERELKANKSVFFPSVNLVGSYQETDGDNYSVKRQIENGAINLSYNIFSFGKDINKIKALQHYLNSIKYKQDQTTQNVIYEVVKNYYSLLSLQAQKDASIETEKASQEAYKSAKLKYKIGIVPLVDKLKSENSYSQSKLNRIKIENEIKKQKANLNLLLNLKPNYVLYLEIPEINIKKVNKNVNEYIQIALENRLELKQLKEDRQSKAKNLMSLKLSRLPNINLSGYIDTTKNRTKGLGDFPSYDSNQITLSVNIPLFNGFYTYNNIKMAEESLKAIDLQIKEMEQDISTEVWNAYYDFDTTQRSYFIAKDLLKTAQESAKVELGMYKNSKSSMLDVLNAQKQLENARYEFIYSKYNFLIYRMKLLSVIGKMNLENIINIDNL